MQRNTRTRGRQSIVTHRPVLEPLDARRLLSGTLPGVPDVSAQFGALEHHAEGLAFTLNESKGAPDASISNHYQGIVRYPGAGTAVFYVTQKNDDSGGYVHVVGMGSRGTDGERLRSNLHVPGFSTELSAPPANDTWVRSFHLDGNLAVNGQKLRRYIHPGGMAIADNILFVAMDTPDSAGLGGTGAIVLFDLGVNGENRLNPKPIKVLNVDHSIDNLGVVSEGANYFIWTNGDGGKQMHIYRTNGGPLRASNLSIRHVIRWQPGSTYDYSGPAWPTGASAHQSSTFIQQSTSETPGVSSPLYMICMRHDGPFGLPLMGDDYADLYKVVPNQIGAKVTFVKSIHETLRYDEAGHLGNFAAATGAYVSPSGELILYSAPHNDEDKFSTDNVRISEIRHRDVVRPNSPLLQPRASAGGPYTVKEGGIVALNGSGTPAVGPWVELFDDDHFKDRSIVIDYADRAKFKLNDFEKLDQFGDKTSSVRWRLPVGMKVELFEDDNFGGSKKTLVGNGKIQEISDLGSFGDETSSLRFVGANPWDVLTYTWDLDGDNVFGETGTAAARGNETGRAPTFVAGTADGPATLPVVLRVTDGAGRVATASTTVTVLNTPPAVTVAGSSDGVPNVAMTFKLTASDPSAVDTLARFTFRVDYGDGTVTTYPPIGRVKDPSSQTASHTYTKRGTYRMVVTATDKNGGVSAAVGRTIHIDTTLPPVPVPRLAAVRPVFAASPLAHDVLGLLDD